MKPVQSSSIAAYKYDPETQTFSVQFVRAAQIYDFFEVPESKVKEFEDAESKGKWFAANIKEKFRFEKRAA